MSLPAAATLLVRDVSRSGHELGRRRLEGLPPRLTFEELLDRRVRADVDAYNAEVGPVFQGLVQPADAVRHSDGFRMRRPRRLDAQTLLAAAREAVTAGLLRARVGSVELDDLGAELDVGDHEELVLVLQRPVVARTA